MASLRVADVQKELQSFTLDLQRVADELPGSNFNGLARLTCDETALSLLLLAMLCLRLSAVVRLLTQPPAMSSMSGGTIVVFLAAASSSQSDRSSGDLARPEYPPALSSMPPPDCDFAELMAGKTCSLDVMAAAAIVQEI